MHALTLRKPGARSWRWFRWRGLLAVVVFGCGFGAFLAGVGADARPGVGGADVMTKAYYTLGLFVLGGLDLGLPVGGSALARGFLWFAYFAAPAISFLALVEGILRAIGPNTRFLRRVRDHVVIGGCGRLTLLYLERLRLHDPLVTVVIVERQTDQPLVEEARDRFGARVVWGDIADQAALALLRLEKARAALLLTGDDFANLDAALKITERAPELPVVTAHVADIRTMRVTERADLAPRYAMFNSLQIAARHLVEHHIAAHFQSTAPSDVIVFAGFGRFGQTVLDELQRHHGDAFDTVVVVDTQAAMLARVFHEQVGFGERCARHEIQADLRDPAAWDAVLARVDIVAREALVLMASEDDAINVRTAVDVARRYPGTRVVARTFRRSLFTEQLAAHAGVALIEVASLVQESMPTTWFEGASRGSFLR